MTCTIVITCFTVKQSPMTTVITYSTLQVNQRSYSQARHIPPKMSDKFESQHSLSPTIWSDVRVDIKRFFFTFLEVNMSNIL
jgi:Zn-dependent M32 family carboxypeptidase